mmetsp:Transcript_40731/g.97763  ORF Transcript_40731/g.97763 Transcript_40731/m.97763 type:complete len:256 (-) Transcript_40731:377-1144(-)
MRMARSASARDNASGSSRPQITCAIHRSVTNDILSKENHLRMATRIWTRIGRNESWNRTLTTKCASFSQRSAMIMASLLKRSMSSLSSVSRFPCFPLVCRSRMLCSTSTRAILAEAASTVINPSKVAACRKGRSLHGSRSFRAANHTSITDSAKNVTSSSLKRAIQTDKRCFLNVCAFAVSSIRIYDVISTCLFKQSWTHSASTYPILWFSMSSAVTMLQPHPARLKAKFTNSATAWYFLRFTRFTNFCTISWTC